MRRPGIKFWRRVIQAGVAVSFIVIPLLNHIGINYLTGNFLSFRAWKLTLADPLAVLQITLKNRYLSTDLMIGAGIALGLAFFLGTVFCSWICPFGFMSELVQDIAGISKKNSQESLRGTGFRIKIILFVLGLSGFFIFSTTPVLNQLSMPAWYSRIFQFYFEQGHISLAIFFILSLLFLEYCFKQRLWCRYICPQAVLLVGAKLINPFRLKVKFDKEKCICAKSKDPCRQACSLMLDPKILEKSIETACNNCGDCVAACKKRGKALTYEFKK